MRDVITTAIKKVTSILSIFLVVFCLGTKCIAVENIGEEIYTEDGYMSIVMEGDNGSTIEVYAPVSYTYEVTNLRIQEIIDTHDIHGDCRITFYEIEDTPGKVAPNVIPRDIFQPIPYVYETTKTPRGAERIGASYFVESCAKGETKTLTKEFTKVYHTQINTGYPFDDTLIGGSSSYTYSVQHTFSGPAEDSPFNSRSFYVRFYVQDYDWVQKKYSNFVLIGVASGTATVPIRPEAYSIDTYIAG